LDLKGETDLYKEQAKKSKVKTTLMDLRVRGRGEPVKLGSRKDRPKDKRRYSGVSNGHRKTGWNSLSARSWGPGGDSESKKGGLKGKYHTGKKCYKQKKKLRRSNKKRNH